MSETVVETTYLIDQFGNPIKKDDLENYDYVITST